MIDQFISETPIRSRLVLLISKIYSSVFYRTIRLLHSSVKDRFCIISCYAIQGDIVETIGSN